MRGNAPKSFLGVHRLPFGVNRVPPWLVIGTPCRRPGGFATRLARIFDSERRIT